MRSVFSIHFISYLCGIILNPKRMILYYLMPVVFIIGILAIALEDVIKINKAATAVGMCIILWLIFLLDAVGIFTAHPPVHLEEFLNGFPQYATLSVSQQAYEFIEFKIIDSLGDVATTLFFVLASMAIIDIIDSHGGFDIITKAIKTNVLRKLLWIIAIITFFISALLGDLAAVIVMIAIARKLIPDKATRLIYSCMIVIAANAGGSWSPIGDVTTLLLWTGGNLTVPHQVGHIFLPAVVMMIIPLIITTFTLPKNGVVQPVDQAVNNTSAKVDPKIRKTVLIVGMASLALVPVLQTLFQLPPFMGVLLGLVVLWVITDRRYSESKDDQLQNLRVHKVFSRVDVTTIFFFLGILMSVQALNATGQLTIMANFLNKTFSNPDIIALVLGIGSSFLDNVALVSAAMGMYPITESGAFMTDGTFWTFLAYCAVTGGSILIIGSASGVTAMGLEKISFGYYFKRFSGLVLLSYLAGAGVYWLLF